LSAALPAALLALAACGTTTRFAPLNSSPHPLSPRPAATVQLLTTSLPSQPYVEIGIIQGTQESDLSLDEMPQIIATMRVEAGRRGCDALVLNGPNNTSPAFGQLSASEHRGALQGFWGTCVVFTGEEQLAGPVIAPAPGGPQPAPQAAPAPVVVPPPAPSMESSPILILILTPTIPQVRVRLCSFDSESYLA
jgi:hypothetical protein